MSATSATAIGVPLRVPVHLPLHRRVAARRRARFAVTPWTRVVACGRLHRGEAASRHDVMVFMMYTQEYGAHCPQPNTRRVYISYVDSVRYFRSTPDGHRSTAYRSLLTSYFASCRRRGLEHGAVEPRSALHAPCCQQARIRARARVGGAAARGRRVHFLREAARGAEADEAREAALVVRRGARAARRGRRVLTGLFPLRAGTSRCSRRPRSRGSSRGSGRWSRRASLAEGELSRGRA